MKSDYVKYLKGTTTIGVVCSDGVVIGGDTRATMGNIIANSESRKVFKIDNNLGITIAGAVGDAQEIIRILKAQNEIYKMNEGRPLSPKSAISLLSIIFQQNKMMPYMVANLVAGLDGDDSQLYSIDPFGGVTEESKFASVGSGSETALGYIEDAYKKGMTTKDAVKVVAKALSIAMRRDSATGDGMIVAAITKSGYTEYSGKDVEKVVAAK
ncbi:MAG: proteasome subunit beta [Candidatus Marsarchaeota archaeon]|jgi:proteasome beta subunit|nr:proteasome subunit beta [Candidatus Marsarchaeota archaeon]MCL5111853.1 proteasome subunit beta [Candidatus Marsarchaeota archaeon]